ncbi:MAG: DUF5715 family protein [Candidatus Azobacteroides sp.]|nr:DUF5715 family protein [Candidatus Azobacteroides sp.]
MRYYPVNIPSFQVKYLSALLAVLFALNLSSCKKEETVKPIHYTGNYNRDFNDLNESHLKSAQALGVELMADREAVEKKKNKLKEVKNGKNYEVEDLTFSIPFLVPQALDLLDAIGKNFSDSLKSLNAPHYKLIVTSITRTQDDIEKLKKKNFNSTENSAHQYATTFDISWKRYQKDSRRKTDLIPEQLKMVLASVLRDLKKGKKCYVKHEKNQGCFHITVRGN